MKPSLLNLVLTFIFLNCLLLSSFGQVPVIKWSGQYPPNPEQNATYSAEVIMETPDGDFLICGHKKIQVGTNPAHSDVFVMKINKAGDFLWSTSYGGINTEDIPHDQKGLAMMQASNGNYIITGFKDSTLSAVDSPPGLLILEISPSGEILFDSLYWNKSLTWRIAHTIHPTPTWDSKEGMVITGLFKDEDTNVDKVFLTKIRRDEPNAFNTMTLPVLLPIGPYPSDATGWSDWMTQSSDGYIIAGSCIKNKFDMFLMKVDTATNVVIWTQIYGSDENDQFSDAIAVGDNYYLAGYSIVPVDGTNYSQAYVIKTESDGEVVWEFTNEVAGTYYAHAIDLAPDGNLVITGTYKPLIGNDIYIFLMKIDSESGNTIWYEDYDVYSAPSTAIQTSYFAYLVAGRKILNSVPQKQIFLMYLGYSAEYSVAEFAHLAIGLGLVSSSDNIDVISVSDLTGNLFGVSVTINELLHSEVDKLVIYLEHGDISVKLVDRPPNPATGFINTTFSDGAIVPIAAGNGTYTGFYKPEELLQAFNGTSPKGDWTLRIIDYSGSSLKSTTETLNGWTIKLLTDGGSSTGVLSPEEIENFLLYPCYPNPLNEETRIEFKIPKKGHVNLSIYNQSGQIVKKLVNTELNEGEHTRIWNAQNVSAGTYFLHLESNGIISVQKLIIIK